VHFDRLLAAVSFLKPEGAPSPDSTTLVEATRDGWWYSAVLPGRMMVAAFMTDPDLLSERRAVTNAGWLDLLAETMHTRGRIQGSRYRLTESPRVVAAGSSLLERPVGPGWIAVGDAAAAHDPLAARGISSALSGGLLAARAVRLYLAGSARSLQDYADAVRRSYALYLAQWTAFYVEERRWSQAAFWQRRQLPVPWASSQRLSSLPRPDAGASPLAADGVDRFRRQ
jgi:2-polyprenyl-6-methoxyphenol hydroxylase-like FAD-dependent oxidoreductase